MCLYHIKDNETVNTFNDIYRLGQYETVDYQILDRVNKFGDAYEVNLKQMLNDISCIPSVLGSSTNIANVSSVAMQILYAMAQVNADETKKWLNIGFRERFERFKKILSMQGISVESDVDVIYNVSMPVATTEMIANLKALQEMGAISKETIMEKSDIVSDVEVEKKRLSGENVKDSPNGETLKTTDNVDNSVDNLA